MAFIIDSNNQAVIFMVRFLFVKFPVKLIRSLIRVEGRVCVRVCGGGRRGREVGRGGGRGGGHADTEDYVFSTREAISLPQTLAVSTEAL